MSESVLQNQKSRLPYQAYQQVTLPYVLWVVAETICTTVVTTF